MKKRIFSVLLAILMLLTLMPMSAFATDTPYAITNGTPESDKETNHGYISIDKTTAAGEETVTVTVNPAEDYQLKSLKVAKTSDTSTAVATSGSGNTYTFTMPEYAVTIAAEFTTDHYHDDKTFMAWDSTNSLPTTSGSWYLTNDVTFSNSRWEIPGNQTIDLCLNGHVIRLDGSYFPNNNISINLGATLNLYDCGTAEHKFTVGADGLWTLDESATENYKTVTGGVITGGKNGIGGAIYLSWSDANNATGATLNMYGGNVVGNQSTSNTQGGGAVFVDRPSTFNMYGGKIIGNTAQKGGAVYINNNTGKHGTFNMYDGSITGNKAGNDGGGVYVDRGEFTMNSGSITDNTAAANGGGVFVNCGTFTMNNGKISDNTGIYGGGVCGYDNTSINTSIIVSNGEISNNHATYGGGVHVNGCTFTMTGGSIDDNKAHDGGGVHVNNSTVTINGTAVIKDNAAEITIQNDTECLGGGVYVQSGTFNMSGGTISGCSAQKGGGVYTWDDMTMSGNSAIRDCTATIDGGGVCACNCAFSMTNNSVVSNCVANNGGGGVYTWAANSEQASFTMSGASKIEKCVAKYEFSSHLRSGGGLCVENSTFIMTGGAITNNTSATDGGGVCFMSGTVTLGGTTQITGNVKGGTITGGTLSGGTANNFYLHDNKTITIGTGSNGAAAPASGFSVGVTTATAPTAGSPVQITTNGGSTDTNYFTSDNAKYVVIFNSNHLELALPVAYNYTQQKGYSSLTEAISEAVSGDEIELWANETAENVVLPDGVTLYAKSGYTGTVTTNVSGKTVAKQDMFGEYQYKYFVANVLTITYKDQGNKTFSGTHESGYPTTFMAEVPTALKTATKTNYTFGGWYDNADCSGEPITGFYAYIYTNNLTLYAKWVCNHTTTRTKVNGQAPTETAAGFKDYYECECGDFFEDATGNVPIEDLAAWKAQGGNGYIAKLPAPDKFTVTFNMNGHGTAPASYTDIASGTTITAPATPTATGYTFGGWFKEAACTTAWNFNADTVTTNTTLYAKWTKNSSHGGGSYTPGHTVTSDLKNVTKVTIDGKVVDSRYYTVSGGNVYLTGEFMKTLANGKHTIKLYDGLKVATGTINVTGNVVVTAPKTADAGIALYGVLSVSSLLGMGWVGKKKRNEE